MIRWLLHRMISAFEKAAHYDATYWHEITDVSRSASARLALLPLISQYKGDVPAALWYGAGIASAMDGDCGPCTQLMVDGAVVDGVSKTDIAALLSGNLENASDDAALGYRMGKAAIEDSANADMLREQIIIRHGKPALVAVAYVASTARVYPVLKRTLGFGAVCQKINLGGKEQVVIKSAA